MKTFKKLLALVLAVVMCVALVTVAGAAEITDIADVNAKCETAVGVMNGMGIITGYDDGSFKPANEVTREQAAKIIAYMLLGKTDADALKAASAPFEDVAADRWSAGYIAYCQAKGIINGRDEKTFDPTGTIKGTEFAKMLLAACGYGAAGEYVGAGWDSNVNVDALDQGIFTGNLAGMGNGIVTREWACLYAYNTMTKAALVKYNRVTGLYGTVAGSLALNNYGYVATNVAEGEVIEKVEYVPATTTAAAYIKATTDGGYTFVASSFDVAGHVVDVYYKDTTTVYYVDDNCSTLVVPATVAADAWYKTATATLYTNYVKGSAGQAYQAGDVLVYTTAANGTKTVVAIQRDSWSDETVTNTAVAAAGAVPAYNYTTLDLATPVVIGSTYTLTGGKAIGGYYFGDATFGAGVVGTPKATNVYYRTVGTQTVAYYEINAVDYVSGTATRWNAGTSKLTVAGKDYSLSGLEVITSGTPSSTQILLGKDYSFRLNAAGALCAIEVAPAASTDYTGYKLGYIAGIYEATTYEWSATAGQQTIKTKYYNIGFIDGTYGTYAVASVGGKKVVANAAYTAMTAAEKALVIKNEALDGAGYVMAKVDGTSVDILALDATAYNASAAATEATLAISAFTKNATQFTTNVYVANTSVFAYVANASASAAAPTGAFKMTFVTGAHDFNGAVADGSAKATSYAADYVTGYTTATQKTISMMVIKAPYYTTSTTAGTAYYYVTKALGQTAAGYEYEAIQVGSTAKTVLTVTTANGEAGNFYTVNATTDALGTTYALSTAVAPADMDNKVFTGSSVAAFTLNGKIYLDTAATIYADSDIVVVDLRDTTAAGYKAIESLDKLPAGLEVIALFDTASTATDKTSVVSYLFIIDATAPAVSTPVAS